MKINLAIGMSTYHDKLDPRRSKHVVYVAVLSVAPIVTDFAHLISD